ncbi:c-type cytochrome [Pseudooceanicola sp. CBS1P-1]|uniref:C-type cytochrome n=1 Tax=Pseudooceanicola albus TaxID=2692189 RepID=A0A6L7GB38_9RHOB|nr:MULTISPECIES: c-type cytochrome [Pseudooceanicola]MBT9387038.1 c-type cytochrome [Pseudooceanicola endophyticus]MXN21189.1 c-type cytochrome [Pseudooceanicola albus]
MGLKTKRIGAAFGLALVSVASAALADDSDLVKRGAYLSKAGDCAACHTAAGGEDMAGGYPFHMPMGTIISSNITPSKEFGIGNWSEEEFAKAVRKGVAPGGHHLLPAMPYTSYSNITDDDMKALYAYFTQAVKPVDKAPSEKTELDFPFNLPGVMMGWDLVFANGKPFTPDPALTDEQNRGKYLAEGLAHCSTCHTPRNQMMAESTSKYLAGADVDGWHAPNITSDKVSGLGGWSDDEIVDYLKDGHAEGKAQAGGPMAEAVEKSFRFLTDEDLHSIAAYLKTVPAIRNAGQTTPTYAVSQAQKVDWTSFENSPSVNDTAAHLDTSSTDGAMLYNTNCAACHGTKGEGSRDGYFPSLTSNSAVGGTNPSNLVMAIVDGIHREGADRHAVMPAFATDTQVIHTGLNNDQIAAVTNYVTASFGQGDAGLKGTDVAQIRQGAAPGFLIRNAATLATIGFIVAGIVALIILALIIVAVRRRKA